ncbi:hypothetical protein OBO34_05365 [Clostridiales Family XIII bacterium ASD5510]|uniref:GLUG domain-containing protein n=1 Tax=Hominibacterium faecale TaxID=2839743 RepID=A0A9J6QJW9_9FIRM|nr:hypothetical protein [Hominibacterium faecale]MCU7377784.1 hypothetical protein [Hominibacterium faecale]
MIRKRIGIFVICFALVTSYLLGGAFVKKNEAHAEVVADWAIGKVLDATLNVVNGVFLKLMGEAIDNTENETLKNIEQFVVDADNLFLAGEADHSSEQILEELNAISNQIDTMDQSIQGALNQMFQYDVKGQVEQLHKGINGIYMELSRTEDLYTAYLQAASDYSQAVLDQSEGKANDDKVEDAKIDFNNSRKNLEKAFRQLDFKKKLDGIASYCCVLYPSYEANAASRRSANTKLSQTYPGQLWTLLNISVPFDHQKYEAMTAAANDCAQVFELALRMNRVYFDYYSAKYENDPDKKSTLKNMSKQYEQMANGTINAINDLTRQFTGYQEMDSKYKSYVDLKMNIPALMRPYDVQTAKDLNYAEKDTHKTYYRPAGWLPLQSKEIYTAWSANTRPQMNFYRIAIDGTPYLFLKDPGVSGEGVVYREEKKVDSGWSYWYYYGQDYFNLLRTSDGFYSMPGTYADVAAITKSDAYNAVSGNLLDYLRKNGGLSGLPSNAEYVMTRDGRGYMLPRLTLKANNYTEMAYWCSTTLNKDNPSKAQAKVDLEDVNYNRSKLIAMLAGDKNKKEQSSVSVSLSDQRGSLTVTDEEGNSISGKVQAGRTLTLKLKVEEGAKLRSLKWVSKDYKTKVDIATGDSLELMKADKDGFYTFTYPMSYQDCTFQADFTNAEEEGEGTEENPYLISSAQDYVDYATKAKEDDTYNKANYKLTADIDFWKEKASKNAVLGQNKEGFNGTFDGGGHTITGMDWWGAFDTIGKDGVVRNLLITTGDQRFLGFMSLIARENNGLITGCGILGDKTRPVTNSYDGVIGAIAQSNGKAGTIENCYNSLSITANGKYSRLGAIAGDNAGIIRNCYNTGDLSSDSSFSYNRKASTVFNCYDAGIVRGSVFSGEQGADIRDVFYQTGKDVYSSQGIGLTEEQMKGNDLLAALNKNVTKTEDLCRWIIKEGTNSGYPILGTVPDRYALSTDIKGKGSLIVADEEDKEIHKAVSGQAVKVTATPEGGRQVDNLKLYDEKGKTIKKLEVKADEKGIVKTSFAMPEQNATVHVKFAKQETPEAGRKETGGKEETGQKDSAVQKKGSGPIYDKAVLTDKDTGITVTGDEVDTRAVLKVEAYDETDPRHEQIEDAASDDVLASYDVSLTLVDEQGKEIKADTPKFKGTLDVAFPIRESDREKDLKVLHGSEDGLKFEDGGLKDDGLYHVSVTHLSPFAVVEHQEDLKADLSAGETLDPGSGGSARIWIVIACIAAVAITASIILIVRKRRKEKGTSQ